MADNSNSSGGSTPSPDPANRQGGVDMRVAIFATIVVAAGCGTLLLTAVGIAVTIIIATR